MIIKGLNLIGFKKPIRFGLFSVSLQATDLFLGKIIGKKIKINDQFIMSLLLREIFIIIEPSRFKKNG